MEFKMPVRYLEAYLPTPRSRKLRYREANDSITVDVLSLSAGEILAVFRVHDYSIHAGGFEAETIYAHSGQLWRRAYEHDFYSGAAHTPATAQTLAEVLGRYRTYGALGNIEEEYAKAREYQSSTAESCCMHTSFIPHVDLLLPVRGPQHDLGICAVYCNFTLCFH